MRTIPDPAIPSSAGQNSSKARANHPAHIIVKRARRIKRVHTAIARRIAHVGVVADIAGGIAPGADGAALTVETGLRAEGGVLAELLAAVIGVELELEVEVAEEAAGGVAGLEGEAGAVAEAGAHGPAGLLLERGAAGGRDDLRVDGGAGVGEVARRVAWRGGPQRN